MGNPASMLFVLLTVGLVGPSAGNGLPPVLEVTRLQAPGDSACQADLTALTEAAANGHIWALRMVDASVKGPVGLLSQTAIQFGDFDECLSVAPPATVTVTAQYCLADVFSTQPNSSWSKFKWAVCVPRSCSAPQLTSSLQAYMDQLTDDVTVEVIPQACTTAESMTAKMSTDDYIYCAIMIGILLTVLVSTIYDVYKGPNMEQSSTPKSIIHCLSARYGYLSLHRPDKQIPGVNTNILHGLRAIAIFFVVLGHRFAAHIFFMSLTNYSDVENMFSDSWFSIWSGHMDVFVDLFFFMSAFILSLFYYRDLHEHFVNPIFMYLHRLSRLVPMCAVVVFFYATLLRHLGHGPMWNLFIDEDESNCYRYWWANLLFINTYATPNNLCIVQTRYVSTDFQLFLLATLLILLFYRMPRLGAGIIILLLIVSAVIPFSVTYVYDLPGMMLFLKDFWTDAHHHTVFSTVYSQAHFRGTTYLIGVMTGIFVYKHRGKTLSKVMTWVLQTTGVVIILLVYWSGAWFHNVKHPPSRFVAASYAGTFHAAFGLGFTLLVTSCVIGKPTMISKCLSWKGFIPVSKLSYSVYLIHIVPQLLWIGSSRTAVYITPLGVVSWTIADFVICLIAAFILNLTVETPARYIFTYYMQVLVYSSPPAKGSHVNGKDKTN